MKKSRHISLKECYEVLQLQKGATLDDVKKSYRRRAFELHPDLNPDNPAASKQFQMLNEAYVALSQILQTDEGTRKSAHREEERTQKKSPKREAETQEENRKKAEAERQAQARKEEARQEKLRREQLRQDKIRAEKLRQERLRQEKLRQEKLREEMLRQKAAREQAARHQAAREQMAREQVAQEEAARKLAEEKAAKEKAEREQAEREEAARKQSEDVKLSQEQTQEYIRQRAEEGRKRAATEAYAKEDVLRDLLDDPFARRVFEDIYSEVHKQDSEKKAQSKNEQAKEKVAPKSTKKEAKNSETQKQTEAKSPLQTPTAEVDLGDNKASLHLANSFSDKIKGWFKQQIDDEQTIKMPASTLFVGSRIRLQIRRGLSEDLTTVEIVLPQEFVVGKPLRLRGLGKKVGKWQGDLYLTIESK